MLVMHIAYTNTYVHILYTCVHMYVHALAGPDKCKREDRTALRCSMRAKWAEKEATPCCAD